MGRNEKTEIPSSKAVVWITTKKAEVVFKMLKSSEKLMPTYPGYVKRMLYFKIKQLSYEKKLGANALDFMLEQTSKARRERKYDYWINRGRRSAAELGLIVPDSLPVGALNEVFADRIYEAKDFLPGAEDVVVDAGAQFGDYSILCSKIYGVKEVHSFEPIERNVVLFKEFAYLNKVEDIRIYQMGLSDTTCTMEMNYSGEMMTNVCNGPFTQRTEFKALDDLQLKVDFLKVDVEGFEMDVLKGAEQTIINSKPRIVMEVHSKKLFRITADFLTRIGYRIIRPEKLVYLTGNIENVFFEPT